MMLLTSEAGVGYKHVKGNNMHTQITSSRRLRPAAKIVGGMILAAVFMTLLPPASGQDEFQPGMGLKLATPDRLRGIPLAFTPYAGEALPASVDLSPDMPPPGHQGNQNSCVGWAIAYALKSYQEKIEERRPFVTGGRIDGGRVFSPSFIYNQCNGGRNVPIIYTDAFNVLSEQGAASWADMPYKNEDFASQPSPAVRQRAGRYKIDYWRQVNTQDLKEVKAHLFAGYPVLIGAAIDQAFIRHPAGTIWNSSGTAIGGHAMVVVGFDDAKRAFKLMNSWGAQWADGGYCWVDYDHFRRVVNEGYVAKDARNGPPPAADQPITPPVITPPIVRTAQAILAITGVIHNATFPNRTDLGYFMRIDGTLEIPAGLARTDQVVVYFYYDNGAGGPGAAVAGGDRAYADINGFAACGTQVYPVPAEGLRTGWGSWIPYGALAVPVGQWVATAQGNVYQQRETRLVAQAVLFIDNFGVARSPFIPFLVRK